MEQSDIKKTARDCLKSFPKMLYWLPTKDLNNLLGVSNSTRRDYTNYLATLGYIEKKSNRRGYCYEEILILLGFKKLSEKFGSSRRGNPEQAAKLLPTLLEELNHGLSGQN